MVRLLPLRNGGRAGLPAVFFPGESTLAGTLASFATQFVGFAARPVGAAIFGHYGDRIGRKAALIATLSLMGAATVLMGILPGYATIGIWAPILLVVLRIVQGIGVGGEWGGSVLMSMEWGSNKRRGFMASLPQLGVPIGLLLSTLAVRVVSGATSPARVRVLGLAHPLPDQRRPGRHRVLRAAGHPGDARPSPGCARRRRVVKQPVMEVIRTQPRAILTSAFVRMAEQAPFYLFITFVLAYGEKHLELDRNDLLNDTLVAAAIGLFSVPFFGYLSDLFGRRVVYGTGIVLVGVFAFPYYGLLNSKAERIHPAGDRDLADPPRHHVRPAGRADLGDVRHRRPVQRGGTGLPAGVRDRRRPGAAHRDGDPGAAPGPRRGSRSTSSAARWCR